MIYGKNLQETRVFTIKYKEPFNPNMGLQINWKTANSQQWYQIIFFKENYLDILVAIYLCPALKAYDSAEVFTWFGFGPKLATFFGDSPGAWM